MRFLRAVFLFLLIGALFLGGAGLFVWHRHHAPGPLAEQTTVIIPRGAGFRGTSQLLAETGVIDSAWAFNGVAVVTGKARRFKAGEYLFEASITPREVMDMLVEGRVVIHKLTVPEGWRIENIVGLLNEEILLTGDITVGTPEGSVLPETYYFLYGEPRQEVFNRMQADMRKLLASLWAARKQGLPLASPQEAVVLASIVERETGVPEERGRIAAVFVNRLKRGMKLQADPTVVYGIEKDQGLLMRELTTADLAYDSPYNTYMVTGLPPGPICNPGRASLEAVLNPPESDELYFVATGDGGHHFASGIKEHNKNVREYRKRLRQQKQ